MNGDSLSTAHVDYLQRSEAGLRPFSGDEPTTSASPALRRLWRVAGVGRVEKSPLAIQGQPLWLPSNDLLVGLYGYKIPLAFLAWGEPAGVAVHVGTWSPRRREAAAAATLDSRQQVLGTMLRSLYTAVELEPAEVELARPPLAGLALGVPTAKPPDALDGALPLDRLIRAMGGANWAMLVLAEPVDESVISDLRHGLINEARAVQAAARSEMAPSPLAAHYDQLLQAALAALTQGQAVGAWRTAAYLLGDPSSYYRLASAWRGIFSGEKSLPEPVRVWDSPAAAALAVEWAMPDEAGSPGPGHYRHPFRYQTLLTSSQLAAYVHLPQLETTGFAVNAVPDFDAVPQSVGDEEAVELGSVIDRTQASQVVYRVALDALDRHAFVAGVTGAGKTNTIFHLLKQCAGSDVPFLVIEPAKAEYRVLCSDPDLGQDVRVFTLGNEMASPLRLNPFEPLPGTPVGVHLDLLRSVFSASFGMWTPLPQILEQCLHRIYVDRGWDITSNANDRVDEETAASDAYPTLSDLLAKVDEVTQELGYGDRVTADLRGALRTRINSLRTGGKGQMLDVRRSLPMEVLLGNPTVLELEGMGDDDDKAFVMGLLLIRLAEHRRGQGPVEGLQHLLVIEEAHRLLTNVGGRGREEEADPRGKAVETFTNLLSEIRAYGQGVLVADQVPLKLAPDVIKNTNLKIAHRVVARDDRAVLAGAMAMSERQAHALATLRVGEAAAFAEGDDAPLLVKVPLVKGVDDATPPDDEALRRAWEAFREREGLSPLFLSYPTCAAHCSPPNPRCADARQIAEAPAVEDAFAAFLLSLVLGAARRGAGELAALSTRLYPAVGDLVQARLTSAGSAREEIRCALTHALYRYLDRRGAQYGWPYSDVARLPALLLPGLLAAAGGGQMGKDEGRALETFCGEYRGLCQLTGPFYGCDQVCQGTCLFRYGVEPWAMSPGMQDEFHVAAKDIDHVRSLCDYVVDQVLLPPVGETDKRQVALCFVIQQIMAWQDYGWDNQRVFVDRMIERIDAADDEHGEEAE